MQQHILDYLKTQRVGVLAVEMLDGAPHAATVHFAHTDEPVVFYFETDRRYRKSEPLFAWEAVRASLVIGVEESTMKTLQLDGTARLVKADEKQLFEEVYFQKFSEKKAKYSGPDVVAFSFTPTWWRFTDWTTPQGKQIWTSTSSAE